MRGDFEEHQRDIDSGAEMDRREDRRAAIAKIWEGLPPYTTEELEQSGIRHATIGTDYCPQCCAMLPHCVCVFPPGMAERVEAIFSEVFEDHAALEAIRAMLAMPGTSLHSAPFIPPCSSIESKREP